MAKENDAKDTDIHENSLGSVKIADDVVASIAAIAAAEVEGVSSIDGTSGENLFSLVGIRGITKGARVEVDGKNVRAEVAIIME